MRTIALAIVLVVGLILPAFAQKAESEAVNAKWIDFFNKGDFDNPRRQATRAFCGARDRDLQPQDQGSDAESGHRQISRGVGEDRKRLEARSRYLERRQVGAGSGMSAFARRRGDRMTMRRREFITLLGGAATT